MVKSPQVDQYILNARPFAQPILQHLRTLVHHACPGVEEKIKWSMPHFDYAGSPMVHMAAFKAHCAFGFWKAALMKDQSLVATAKEEIAMGHLGKINSLEDLPADKKIIAWIKEAMKLNEAGQKVARKTTAKTAIAMPPYFKLALSKNLLAKEYFDTFSASAQREYLEWVTEAKTEATRNKRLVQAIEWIAEGKKRNWKYERTNP